MKFWDSSALVPLLVKEKQSTYCLQLLSGDTSMLIWNLSRVEVISALCGRLREGGLDVPSFRMAKASLMEIVEGSFEVSAVEKVRARAIRLLEVHHLRAADACQLAAALVATRDEPDRLDFICFDDRLKQAADKEGFRTNPPE